MRKRKRIGGARGTWFTRDEVRLLFAAAFTAEDKQAWLMMLVTYWHAMRPHELVGKDGMRMFQIDGDHMMLYRGKGSNRTSQKLVEDADELFNEKAALTAFCAGKPKNELLFPFTRQWANKLVLKYGLAAGLPKAKLHMYSLRHSIAHHLLKVSDLPTVQRRLGHKSISSTAYYTVCTDEQASEAIESLTTKPTQGENNGN